MAQAIFELEQRWVSHGCFSKGVQVKRAFLRTDAFISVVCQCNHSNQNLMMTNIVVKMSF